MTKACCVPGCKSNYNSTLKAGAQLVSTFSFPKDELLRAKWLRALPRDNWSPSQYSVVCGSHFPASDIIKDSVVCGLHFPESDIIREDNYLLPEGTVQKIPKKIRLSPTAVPSIFPHLAQLLSKKVTHTRKSRVERRKSGSKCMVHLCKTQGIIPGIKYFRLTHIRHDSWLRALGRNPDIEQLSYSNRVCSIHFSENDIVRRNNKIINIKPGAVPTKLLGITNALAPVDNTPVTSGSAILDNTNLISLGDRIKTEITDTEDKYKTDSFANESSFITLKKPKEEVCDEDFLDSPMLLKQEEIMVKDEDGQNISDIVENINHVVSSGDRINNEVTETEEISKSDSFENEMSFVTLKVPKEEVCDEEFLDSPILLKQEEIMIKDEESGQNRDDSTEDIQPEQKGELECFHCNYQTIEEKEMKKHLLQHKNLKRTSKLKCDQCDYQTSIKQNLTRHYVSHKNADEAIMYKCDRCDHQTKWKANLTHHNLIHKKPVEIYMCYRALCDFQTTNNTKLEKHLLGHKRAGEAIIYRCDHCDFKTKWKCAMINHITIHKTIEGSITYRCDQCDYQTISECSLKSHHLIHKKPVVGMYKCNQCDYQTVLKVYLAKHQKTHKIAGD